MMQRELKSLLLHSLTLVSCYGWGFAAFGALKFGWEESILLLKERLSGPHVFSVWLHIFSGTLTKMRRGGASDSS